MMNNKFRDLIVDNIEQAKIILVGLPFDEGCSCGKGASLAPDVIRKLSGFLPPLTMDGNLIKDAKIFDYGDIIPASNYFEKIKNQISPLFATNKFLLSIGGDHSVSIPLQESFYQYWSKQNKVPVIIHIDAHPDICGEYDGSENSHACTNRRAIDHGYLTEHINLIGIRGFEEQEVEYFTEHPEILVYKASTINKIGYEVLLKTLILKYQDPKYVIYLSYDIDANDPSFAPGTGTPEAFGLDSYQLMLFIKQLFVNLSIKAMDIVEVSPPLDNNDITSWLALKTIYEILEILQKKGDN